MTKTQARNWAYAAAAAGVTANALFVAFYASFAVQHFAAPRGAAAIDPGDPRGRCAITGQTGQGESAERGHCPIRVTLLIGIVILLTGFGAFLAWLGGMPDNSPAAVGR